MLTKKSRTHYWNCLCTKCNREYTISGNNLKSGATTQCRKCSSITHGGTLNKEPEYMIWFQMKDRCGNAKNKNYHRYGGRGISVCDRWSKSYQNFIDDMGYRPTKNHSIERVNNDGDYSPDNCEWIHISMQNKNTSRAKKVYIPHLDKSFPTIADAAVALNLSKTYVSQMLSGSRLNRFNLKIIK